MTKNGAVVLGGIGLSEINTEIGKVIRRQRKTLDFTQEKLAELADLNVTFIGEIERGHTNPTVDTLNKISEALQLSLGQLINAAESREKPKDQVQQLLTEYTDRLLAICEKRERGGF